MVKGVNKTIIEINDTGNELFEKIILYVSPKYSNLNPLKLKAAATKELDKFGSEAGYKKSLRAVISAKRRKRKIITTLAVAVTAVLVIGASLLLL